eukprot:986443-Rhodomonas_salina.2
MRCSVLRLGRVLQQNTLDDKLSSDSSAGFRAVRPLSPYAPATKCPLLAYCERSAHLLYPATPCLVLLCYAGSGTMLPDPSLSGTVVAYIVLHYLLAYCARYHWLRYWYSVWSAISGTDLPYGLTLGGSEFPSGHGGD